MRVYVDFDDVISETARALSQLAADLFGRDVPYERIEYFNLQQSFQLDDAQMHTLMLAAHSPSFLAGLAETEGAKAGLEGLLVAGHTVTIVTGRPVTADAETRSWLTAHAYPSLPILYVDKYKRARPEQLLDGRKALSPEEFAEIPFDLALDDSPMALDLLALRTSCRTLVFSRPWNRSYTLTPSMRRIMGWKDVTPSVWQL